MARPTLFTHRKFRTLARLLRSRALAVGSLELIWAAANESGDPLIGTAEDVEDVADWRGKPGVLIAALSSCGFLDDTPDGYVVHDHAHHCPSYVRRRRDREHARRGADAPVTRQRLVSDAPLTRTPISHLPTPITPHPAPDTQEARAPVNGTAVADDVWQLWRTAASAHGTDIRLAASHTETLHLIELASAYTLDDLQVALRAWWASPYVPSRSVGLFKSQVADVLAHCASGSTAAFRAPPGERVKAVKAVPPGGGWTCPHTPRCERRWACERKTQTAALVGAREEA